MAMAVPSRLWLGGVVSARRDLTLIMAVVGMVRRAAKGLSFLVCVDGLASYVTAFTRVFRDPVRTGRRGRPRLEAIPGLLLGQVIKHHSGRRLVDVTRRVVLGTAEAIAGVLSATGTGTGINTSYIERLNATFRASMCPLVRRGRAIARGEGVLTGWMYLVGCAYNFCWEHDSLRVAAPSREVGSSGSERTPAMAAGLTDHRWTMHELLSQPIPLPPWVAPKRRGRPPRPKNQPQGRCGMTTVPCGATPGGVLGLPDKTSVDSYPDGHQARPTRRPSDGTQGHRPRSPRARSGPSSSRSCRRSSGAATADRPRATANASTPCSTSWSAASPGRCSPRASPRTRPSSGG